MSPHPIRAVLQGADELAPLPVMAAALAEAGVPVFPCAPGGKRPVTGHGFHDATTDLARVEAWWRRVPEANIGMPTGAASGLVVVDVDVHGTNGYQALSRARRAGLVSRWEFLARSPSGGLHVYFPADPSVEQPSWQAGRAGIDFRGDRGYIIVPPSRRLIDGQTIPYRATAFAPLEGRPLDAQHLRAFVDPPRPPRPVSASRQGRPVDAERLAAWLGAQSTDRNLKLFWASCRLAEGGVDMADALDAFARVAQPDFWEREIARTVHSAYRTIGTAETTRPAAPSARRGARGFEVADAPEQVPRVRGL